MKKLFALTCFSGDNGKFALWKTTRIDYGKQYHRSMTDNAFINDDVTARRIDIFLRFLSLLVLFAFQASIILMSIEVLL